MGKTGVISNKKLCRGKVFGCVKDKITQIPVLWVLSHPKHLSLVTFTYYVSMFIPQKNMLVRVSVKIITSGAEKWNAAILYR